jgi:CheY-like chemotaxis protein/HPt (histidine-containing phosphotransfer) domain-containing protein
MDGWRIGHAIRSVHRRPDKYISPRMPDPHIDLTYLERLYKGDRARIAQWIHIYLEEAPAQFQRLSDSLEKNDTERLASAAHDLRPQAHYVGAVRMLELLIAIGQRARPFAMIRLALADDQILFRKGHGHALAGHGRCASGAGVRERRRTTLALKRTPVDIVLLDLQMPVLDGIETTKRIKQDFPQVKVIILSTHDEEAMIAQLMELGANGYMLKTAEPDEIDTAIRSVARTASTSASW